MQNDTSGTCGGCQWPIRPNVIVGELRARTKVHAPPGIMYEEATPMVQNRILNRRIWIPVGRTRWICRFELIRRFAILHSPDTWQRGTFDASSRYIERSNQLSVPVDA